PTTPTRPTTCTPAAAAPWRRPPGSVPAWPRNSSPEAPESGSPHGDGRLVPLPPGEAGLHAPPGGPPAAGWGAGAPGVRPARFLGRPRLGAATDPHRTGPHRAAGARPARPAARRLRLGGPDLGGGSDRPAAAGTRPDRRGGAGHGPRGDRGGTSGGTSARRVFCPRHAGQLAPQRESAPAAL